MQTKKISIDFDGVIHDFLHPIKRMGAPIQGAKESLLELARQDYEIIIFTVRANTEQSTKVVKDWMDYYEIPYSNITNIKENCDLYIDDKALKFNNWDNTLKEIYAT